MLKKIRQKMVKQMSPSAGSTERNNELTSDKNINSPPKVKQTGDDYAEYEGNDLDMEVGFDPTIHGRFGGKTDSDKLVADFAQLAKDVDYVDFDERQQRTYGSSEGVDKCSTFRATSPLKQSSSPLAKKNSENESGYATLDDINAQLKSSPTESVTEESLCNSYDNYLYQIAVKEARANASRAAVNLTYGDPSICLSAGNKSFEDGVSYDPGYSSLTECSEKSVRHLSAGSGDSQIETDFCDNNEKIADAVLTEWKNVDAMYAKAAIDKKKANKTKYDSVNGEGKKSDAELYPPLPERRYSSMETSDSGVSDGHEDDNESAEIVSSIGTDQNNETKENVIDNSKNDGQVFEPNGGQSKFDIASRVKSPLQIQIPEETVLSQGCSPRSIDSRGKDDKGLTSGIATSPSLTSRCSSREDINMVLQKRLQEVMSGDEGIVLSTSKIVSNGLYDLSSSESAPECKKKRECLVNTLASPEAEPTHMSWDEVIHEAKVLGIPLNKPLPQPEKVKEFVSPAKVPEKKKSNFREKFTNFFGKKHNHVSADDVTNAGIKDKHRSRRGHSDIELTSEDDEWNSSRSVSHSAISILPSYMIRIHHKKNKSHHSIGERLASPGLQRNAVTPPPRYLSQSCDKHLPADGTLSQVMTSKKVQRTHSCNFMRSVSANLRRTPSASSRSSLSSANTAGYNAGVGYLSSPHSMGATSPYGGGGSVSIAMMTYGRQASCEATLGYRSMQEKAMIELSRKSHHHHHHRDRLHSDTVLERPNVSSNRNRNDRPVSDGLTRSKASNDTSRVMTSCWRRPSASVSTPANDVAMSSSGASLSLSNDVMSGSISYGISASANALASLSKLKDVGWYWGPLSWEEAEAKLDNKPDGAFLVRDSSDDHYILSLTFRSHGTTHHTRIEHYKGMFSFYSQPKSHGASTITEFIEKAMEHSRSGRYLYFLRPRAPGLPPAPIQLLYPISRFRQVASLQHLCRFLILKQVRRDHISQLPVPKRIADYLEQSQYYAEYPADSSVDV